MWDRCLFNFARLPHPRPAEQTGARTSTRAGRPCDAESCSHASTPRTGYISTENSSDGAASRCEIIRWALRLFLLNPPSAEMPRDPDLAGGKKKEKSLETHHSTPPPPLPLPPGQFCSLKMTTGSKGGWDGEKNGGGVTEGCCCQVSGDGREAGAGSPAG